MTARGVVDPNGVRWSVRRRWYPWRRTMSLRGLLSSTPTGQTSEPAAAEPEESSELPRNVVVKVLLVLLAAIVWVLWSIGKLLFYTGVVAVFLVISLAELVLQLAIMPIVLLLRLIGVSTWPVEIRRAGEHVETRSGEGFAAAGEVCDGVRADIQRGVLPGVGDSKSQSVGSFED